MSDTPRTDARRFRPAGGEYASAVPAHLAADMELELAMARSELAAARAERDLARNQRDGLANFNPDWDMLAATKESLNEHMKMLGKAIKERDAARAELAAARECLRECMRWGLQHCGGDGSHANVSSRAYERWRKAAGVDTATPTNSGNS